MYVGISPVRISLAGGGTDMPEYYEKYGGSGEEEFEIHTKERVDKVESAIAGEHIITHEGQGMVRIYNKKSGQLVREFLGTDFDQDFQGNLAIMRKDHKARNAKENN